MEARLQFKADNQRTNRQPEQDLVDDRLKYLLLLNKANARRRSLYRSDREMRESALMANPITMEKAYSRFGLFLGLFPTTAIFIQVLGDISFLEGSLIFPLLFLAAIAGTSVAGYLTGGVAARAVRNALKRRLSVSLSLLPLIGFVWGAVSGALGGLFLFGIGAVFGGIFGAVIGTVAVPVFALTHNLLRKGDFIEQKHFLPLALGNAITVSALLLGL